MKPKTVNELLEELTRLQKRGYGEYLVLVSDDEECNGYHPLYGDSNSEGGWMEFYDVCKEKNDKLPTITID